jgi:hypothetical protein
LLIFSKHFLGYHFTKILLSGHFPQKFRLLRRLTFIFCFMLVQGAPKSKLPGAREDLNPALAVTQIFGFQGIFHASKDLRASEKLVCNL